MARITVVNDRDEFLEIMREILEPSGHDVITMTGADLDIEDLAATDPDLMVIDLLLDPGHSRHTGWELIVLSRAHGRLADIPIILSTADPHGALQHNDELQAMTDVHVLLKPFNLEEAEELVARLLDREPRAKTPRPEGFGPEASAEGA